MNYDEDVNKFKTTLSSIAPKVVDQTNYDSSCDGNLLHHAISAQKKEYVVALLEHRVDPKVPKPSSEGNISPLHLAVKCIRPYEDFNTEIFDILHEATGEDCAALDGDDLAALEVERGAVGRVRSTELERVHAALHVERRRRARASRAAVHVGPRNLELTHRARRLAVGRRGARQVRATLACAPSATRRESGNDGGSLRIAQRIERKQTRENRA